MFPHVDESQLACWGLGRGIKATEPKRLMQVVARPVPVDETNDDETIATSPCVEETRVGTGYSEVTFKVSSKTELTRNLSSTLSAPFSKAVTFECGFCYEKTMADSGSKIAVGHQIRNRTYTFRLHAYDERKHVVDPVSRTFVEDCILNEFDERSCNGKTDSPARMPELTSENKEASVSACRRAIVGPLGGVTHFVAAIDMGGKVYREIATTSTRSKTVTDGHAAVTIQAANAAAKFRNDQGSTQTTYSKNERVFLHPNIIGKRLKRDQTIKRDEEVVVCLRVLPIAALVRHPVWADSMRIASRKFIEDELQRLPHVVDLKRPFYLKAGRGFVTAHAHGKLGTTEVKGHATPVYIEPLSERWHFPWESHNDLLKTPGAAFLLAFDIDGQKFYLSTSSRSRYEAVAATHVAQTSDGLFSLCHPGSNRSAALHDWRATPLSIEWRSGFFSRRYLQLMPNEKKAVFLRRDDRRWQNTDGLSQFQLINASEPVTSEMANDDEISETALKIN